MQDQRYLVLQHDMTDDERRLIARDRRRSAGLRPACRSGKPGRGGRGWRGDRRRWQRHPHCGLLRGAGLGVDERPPHWYWGPDGTVATLYDDAVTGLAPPIRMALPAGARRAAKTMPGARDRAGRCAAGKQTARPGHRGAAFGHVADHGVAGTGGLWTGTTVPGGPPNPKGFFENARVREGLTKPVLQRLMAADPLGVQALPDPDLRFAGPHWAAAGEPNPGR
ncbi:MAG: hypothetical protein JKP98_17610 [Rhodobacteraceae bacterium]|nr:hypothetical protein [Paracoccaceae bacterium]